jgi:hypothetical protein
MRKFKARSGGVGAASPGARERVSRSRIPLRLTRNRVATCRLEPSRFSLVCTTRRRQSRAEGRRDCSVHVGFPYASVVVHASANRCPSTPRRAPDRRLPARMRRPGARGYATARLPTWPVSPCQGRKHLIGRSSQGSMVRLNRSTRDSYTRCHGNSAMARLRVLPVCQYCMA